MAGKEKTIVAVLVALSVGTLISAVAHSFPVMLAGRVVQGAGGPLWTTQELAEVLAGR